MKEGIKPAWIESNNVARLPDRSSRWAKEQVKAGYLRGARFGNRVHVHSESLKELRFYQGRLMAEVGAELGISEDAAKMRVARALEKLRRLLARKGVTLTAVALGAVLSENVTLAAPAGLVNRVKLRLAAGAGTASLPVLSLLQGLRLFPALPTRLAVAAGLTLSLAIAVWLWPVSPAQVVTEAAKQAEGQSQRIQLAGRTPKAFPRGIATTQSPTTEAELLGTMLDELREALTAPHDSNTSGSASIGAIPGPRSEFLRVRDAALKLRAHPDAALVVVQEVLNSQEEYVRRRAYGAMFFLVADPPPRASWLPRSPRAHLVDEALWNVALHGDDKKDAQWALTQIAGGHRAQDIPYYFKLLKQIEDAPSLESSGERSEYWVLYRLGLALSKNPEAAATYREDLGQKLQSKDLSERLRAANLMAQLPSPTDPGILETIREGFVRGERFQAGTALQKVKPETAEAFPELYAEVRRMDAEYEKETAEADKAMEALLEASTVKQTSEAAGEPPGVTSLSSTVDCESGMR